VNGSQHSGECIYCAHGPYCTDPDCLAGLVLPGSAATLSAEGPVCSNCHDVIIQGEIAADPYYRGDYLEMFGHDE